jgi:hypothetical protein
VEALYRAGSGWRVGFDGAEKRQRSMWMRKRDDGKFFEGNVMRNIVR